MVRGRHAVMVLAVVWAAARRAVADDQPPGPGFQTVVTAPAPEPAAPRADRTSAATVVVPSTARAYQDLGTLLLEVPGVTVTRTGSAAAYSTVALRGSNPDEVLVYLDGVPLNLAQGGGVDLSTLPLGDVDRVEVYRGSTPLQFGQSALGGVVSILTRTPGTDRATARAGVGSFGTRFGDATGGGRVGRLRLYLGAHVLSTRGDYPYLYDNNTATDPTDDVVKPRANNDALEGNGVLRAALSLTGRRTLGLSAIGFARAEGISGPTNYPTVNARFHTGRGLASLRYESRDDLGPGGRLSAQAFTSLERNRLLDPSAEVLQRGPVTVHTTTLATGAIANASRPLGEWTRGAAVLEARRETYTPVDEVNPARSGVPARRLLGVAGGEVDVRIRPLDLHVVPTARLQLLDDVVSGQGANGLPLPAAPAVRRALPDYRLGLLRPLGSTATVKANAGRYVRVPSFIELYGNGDNRLLGNPKLVPERGLNADLALWLDWAGPRFAVRSRTTLFGALADDLMIWTPVSQGSARAQNVGAARVYGVEQELRLAGGRHLRLTAQGTVTVATDQSDDISAHGRQLPRHPRYMAYARPELARIALGATFELDAFADAALFAQDYNDRANLESVPSRALLGAGVSLLWRRPRLRVTASAINLTDLQTFDIVYWPLPGRELFVSLGFDSSAGDPPPELAPAVPYSTNP